jgi:predicted Zn-dependent protease
MNRRPAILGLALILGAAFPLLSSCASLQSIQTGLGDTQQLQRDFQRSARQAGEIAGWAVERVRGFIPVPSVSEIVHRIGLANNNLGPDEEYFLGRSVLAELLTDFDNRLVGVVGTGRDAKANPELAYVASVAQVVLDAAAANPGRHDRPQTALRVAVVRSDVPNAYAAPGGFVLVTTGMLALTTTEDELAAVLAHEMAHVALGHGVAALGVERLQQPIRDRVAQVEQLTGEVRAQVVGELAGELGDFSTGIADSLRGGYDRDWEHQADARAANILSAAGYDAGALLTVIRRVDEWQRAHGAAKSVASTHPTAEQRATVLNRIPEHKLQGEALAEANATRANRFEGHVPVMTGGEVARR